MTPAAAVPDAVTRRLITASVMAATLMNSLDTTIANVALPHIQGSVAASAEQITWVLTSYIVAAAIMTPLTGWLASRFGRRRLMQVSIIGFTVASGLCGIAHTLGEIVGFRLLQGIFGAALVPMSQAILLDINPPEKHGQAMAIWMMGAIVGPILGPVIGGWLTDNLTWRWVFFINLPVGVLAFLGVSAFLNEIRTDTPVRLDFLGFAALGIAIGALQMMLDRGQQLDWFSSTEIWIEAGVAALCLYIFIVQTMTARAPFVDPRLFMDRNFLVCTVIGFIIGALLFAVLSVLPQLLEGLMGYPVVTTGLVMAPRGVGSFIAAMVIGQLGRRLDGRLMIGLGLLLNAVSLFMLSHLSLQADEKAIILSGFIQGLGSGMVFAPLATMAFATLDVNFRNEGAAMFTLLRNLGSSIGISLLQVLTFRNTQTVQSRLVEGLRPDNPAVLTMPSRFSLTDPSGIAALGGEVSRQSAMVSYVDAFWLLGVVSLLSIGLIIFLSPPRKGGEAPAMHME